MAQFPDKKIPLQGIDMDSDELRMQQNKAAFMKGLTFNVNKNASSQAGEGNNLYVLTPLEGNKNAVTQFSLPGGDNQCIGSFECKETNEAYFFIWNSGQDHTIIRISGNGDNQIVYYGRYLNFQNDPKYYISEGRCVMYVVEHLDLDGVKKQRKLLIFTDNYNDQRCISIEDSINTSYFQIPYFTNVAGYDCSPGYLINLGVANSQKCIGITPITQTEDDENLPNLMNNKGWEWRIKYVDHYDRQSEPGIISDRYFVSIGQNCIQTNPKLPRCVTLNIDAGCPLVEHIEIWFRTCTTNNSGLSTDSDWFLYDTLDKYDNCSSDKWYERTINSNLDYNTEDNTFDYKFCADKECQPIDVALSSRTENPLPLTSSGVAPINQGIMLSNNVRGFDPLECEQLDKISYTVTDPNTGCDNTALRKVVIYVPIYNPQGGYLSGLWVYEGDNPTIFWGHGTSSQNPQNYGQYFVPGNYGFLGYFAGTQYTAMSTQVYLEVHTGKETYLGFIPFPKTTNIGPQSSVPGNTGTFIFQKFEFEVPPGKYSFRIASPLVLRSEGYQFTSTNVYGQCLMNNCPSKTSEIKELEIDCCAGDVILNQPTDTTLVIYDMSFGPYVCGHIKQDSQTLLPIEYVPISDFTSGNMIITPFTDHNGFFFGASSGLYAQLRLDVDVCVTTEIIIIPSTGGNFTYSLQYAYGPGAFPVEAQRLIEGNVKTCDGTVGIAGALVVALGAQWTLTDSNGHFKLILHQRLNVTLPPDTLILSQSGGCVLVDCDDGCDRCFDDKFVAYNDCATYPNRGVVVSDWLADILGNVKGPSNGGRYGLGITMYDWMGRHSFIQANESHYITTKDITETHAFAFSTIGYALDPSIVFPPWVHFIVFSVTQNLNLDDYISWVADSVQLIDSGGNVNSSAPVKIRIYYESLNEYNKQNGFATNTNWQFLVPDTTGEKVSVAGDRVQFILNGDGTWFSKNINVQVTYDQAGKYFDIAYINELKDLKAGALIKLIRPKDCITQNIYYDTCSTVRVRNGIPERFSGTINTFDAYFLNRQIPIPQEQTDSAGKIVRTVIATYFSFFFESPSPSDFWGDHCANRGRPNVKNPYERQRRFGSEIARSKALLSNGNFNGLSFYSDDDRTEFEEQEWGNIVVALPEINTILVICEHNNFIVGFNDTIPVINDAGQLVVASSNNRFGPPQRKIGSDYGCQPQDINTIRKLQGIVIYLDRNRFSLLQHDYSEAKDIAVNGYKGYINRKIRFVNEENLNNGRAYNWAFIGGVNPRNNEYFLTAFGRKLNTEGIGPLFINNSHNVVINANESICIDYNTGALKSFAPFTPEYFGTLNGYYLDRAMITVRDGIPWVHVVEAGTVYNNFYLVQCKKIIQIVNNLSPEKVKRFMYAEVYCPQHKFIADSVTTESNQQSHIPAVYWEYRGKFWCAAFLCDVNTFQDPNSPIIAIAPLTDGNVLTGRWNKVTYISEDADDGKYCELDGIITYVTGVEKSGD